MYSLQLPARFYRALFYAANSRLPASRFAELFGPPPYNFLGPEEGLYISRSRELQRETPLTRNGTARAHKSGAGREIHKTYVCASRREFGPGSACFKRAYEPYIDAFLALHDAYPKVFDIGFRHQDPFLHVGGWCFEEWPASFSLILEERRGTRAVWSVARHKTASFSLLTPRRELVVQRRRPKTSAAEPRYAEAAEQYAVNWRVKIVSLTPLSASNRALTARIVTTSTRYPNQ